MTDDGVVKMVLTTVIERIDTAMATVEKTGTVAKTVTIAITMTDMIGMAGIIRTTGMIGMTDLIETTVIGMVVVGTIGITMTDVETTVVATTAPMMTGAVMIVTEEMIAITKTNIGKTDGETIGTATTVDEERVGGKVTIAGAIVDKRMIGMR
jgi:hypothetical protein